MIIRPHNAHVHAYLIHISYIVRVGDRGASHMVARAKHIFDNRFNQPAAR